MQRVSGKKQTKGFLYVAIHQHNTGKINMKWKNRLKKQEPLFKNHQKNKRLKFTKSFEEKLQFNQALIDKIQKILEIKGYNTNIA